MKENFSIDEIYCAQLNAWEDLLIKVLHAQSDSIRSGLRSVHPEQTVDSFTDQLCEYSHKQLENWVVIEQEFLNIIFQSIKEIEPTLEFKPESVKETAHRFIDHWGNRTGKALEAHTDFYALIFPWDDGEPEAKDAVELPVKTETKEVQVHRDTAEAA